MASGSQRATRSVELRAGEFGNTGGQYVEYPSLESISGRWEGKPGSMHCDGVRFFDIGLGCIIASHVLSHIIDESINKADT
jgi:hypothetical protein